MGVDFTATRAKSLLSPRLKHGKVPSRLLWTGFFRSSQDRPGFSREPLKKSRVLSFSQGQHPGATDIHTHRAPGISFAGTVGASAPGWIPGGEAMSRNAAARVQRGDGRYSAAAPGLHLPAGEKSRPCSPDESRAQRPEGSHECGGKRGRGLADDRPLAVVGARTRSCPCRRAQLVQSVSKSIRIELE